MCPFQNISSSKISFKVSPKVFLLEFYLELVSTENLVTY